MESFIAVRNNKLTGQLALEENNVRYLSKQGSKLYSVKVDIESFYPNVYTHYLGKIKERFPFNGNFSCDKYFDFLDYRLLKKMSDKGRIKLVGSGRSAYYELIK